MPFTTLLKLSFEVMKITITNFNIITVKQFIKLMRFWEMFNQ